MNNTCGLTAQEVRDLQFVYQLFDVSGRRLIGNEDLRKALKLLGFNISRKAVQKMAQDVEVSKSLKNLTSFDNFLQIVAELQGTSYDQHEEILQVRVHLFL